MTGRPVSVDPFWLYLSSTSTYKHTCSMKGVSAEEGV